MNDRLPPVATLLPHSGRAVLLDELLAETAHGVVAAAHIDARHPYYSAESGGVPSWVGIELMAQAIAVHAGLIGRREGHAPYVGYLLGTRRYLPAVTAFPAGSRLSIAAERLYLEPSGIGAYDCSISDNGRLLIQASLTVFQTREETHR